MYPSPIISPPAPLSPFTCYAKQTSAIRRCRGVLCVGLDRTWWILSLSLSLSLSPSPSLSLLACVPVVEKELMVVRATGQYGGADGRRRARYCGGIVQGAPLNSIPEGNSREDKRWADANRREPPGRRSMLMARARPDGLPSPLNMYRRVLYLRSLYLRRRRRRRRFAFLFSPFDTGAPDRSTGTGENTLLSLFLSLSVFLTHYLSKCTRFSRVALSDRERSKGDTRRRERTPPAAIESDYERLAFGADSN